MSLLNFALPTPEKSGFRSWFHLASHQSHADPAQELADDNQNTIHVLQQVKKDPTAVLPQREGSVIAGALLSAADYEAWLQHLKSRKVTDLRRGLTLTEEYEQWMRKRAKARA